MRGQGGTVEQVVGRIAHGQHGLVSRAQLSAAGLSSSGIDRRLRSGALLREYPGVYRVGHRAPSAQARYLAAVLACGENALLCGRAAGHLLGLLKGRQPPPEVTAATKRRIDGIRTRRSRDIDRREAMSFRHIPVTTVSRTLVDLAAVLTLDELARACHEAGVLHGTTPGQVEAVLARHPNRRGAGKLRRVLRGEVHVTLSKLERRFLQLLRENGLPPPRTNRPAST